MQKTFTMHVERRSQKDVGYAAHNDRTHITEKHKERIDLERSKDNVTLIQKNEELLFEELFKDGLDAQNQKYHDKRQYMREKTMQEFKQKYLDPKSKNCCIYEAVLQMGDRENTGMNVITQEEKAQIECVWREYVSDFKERNKSNCIVTQAIIHYDEDTPHMHLRVMFVSNKKGYSKPSRKQALIELGYGGEDTLHNNPTSRFTKAERERYIKIGKRYGIEHVEGDGTHNHQERDIFIANKHLKQENTKLKAINDAEIERGKKISASWKNLYTKAFEKEQEHFEIDIQNDYIEPLARVRAKEEGKKYIDEEVKKHPDMYIR